MRVLALGGSLRDNSYNRKLLRVAATDAADPVRLDIWDGLGFLPIFDEDLEAHCTPLAVARLKKAIRSADALMIASPEYNASMPGGLKNALDWVSRPYATNVLRGKAVALVGASPSPRGARGAQEELRRVLGAIGADVIASSLAVSSVHRRFSDGMADAELRTELKEMVAALTNHASATEALAG
jgi:chromate reductase